MPRKISWAPTNHETALLPLVTEVVRCSKRSLQLVISCGGAAKCKPTYTINQNLIYSFTDQIVKRTLNEQVEVRHLDLCSLASVRKFSAELHRATDHVDALILYSAPDCEPATTVTVDKLNTIMQQHHFSPFLLTNLVLGEIKVFSYSHNILLKTD